MFARLTCILLPTLLLCGCPALPDLDPEQRTEDVSIFPGEELLDTVASKRTYTSLAESGYEWTEYLEDLPDGFHYETDYVEPGDDDRLYVDYWLGVEPWVEPGVYEFWVDIVIRGPDALFEEEVQIRFRVEVEEDDGHGPVELMLCQEVPPPGEAGHVLIRIGG
jgi:hypothetical protein